MFEFVSGILVEKSPAEVVIDAGGIGYLLRIPVSSYEFLPSVGETVSLYTHLQVREDAWNLFGFASKAERELFRLLITVSGVGPKVAITVLSGIGAAQFQRAVIDGDVDALKAVPGIGKKTAERIIVDLKEKVSVADVSDDASGSVQSETIGFSDISDDAVDALLALGYKKATAVKAVGKVRKEVGDDFSEMSVEEIIRRSLTFV